MPAGLPCCAAAACCTLSSVSLPSFTVGGASAWAGAAAFALLVTGAVLAGWFVAVEVARALGAAAGS
jgi:hypothetical protein